MLEAKRAHIVPDGKVQCGTNFKSSSGAPSGCLRYRSAQQPDGRRYCRLGEGEKRRKDGIGKSGE